MRGRKKEEADSRCVHLENSRRTDAASIIFAIASQLGGWSDVFAYMSIRDAYLPGFKILPSVQFFARMWHVAILVTSGLRRAIYWPPSAASTIYLPPPRSPFSTLAITRCLFLAPSPPFSFSFPFSLLSVFFSPSFVLYTPFFSEAVSSLSASRSLFYLDPRSRSSWNATASVPWTSISQTFCLGILQYRQLSSYKLVTLWII